MVDKRGNGSLARLLVVGTTVVATCFLAAIGYFEWSTFHVTREARGMLDNGVPSAEQLTRVRAALRGLVGALDRALLDLMDKQPFDRAAIERARRQIDDEIADYHRVP